ncbi:hypothetical protein FACS189487_02460 [Campylobacterota bacterium]|nr:hypothetical protein FACS189487_02460 [Campylobacterota bacterium]
MAEKNDEIRDINDPRFGYDIPMHLTPAEAVWYYNYMERRRGEVYQMCFARLKSMDEWLEVYTAAQNGTAARELAIEKLTQLKLSSSQCVGLYEAQRSDEKIAELCTARFEEIAGGDIVKWRDLFDLSTYGSNLRTIALNKMRLSAQTIEDWQSIYDRTDIGSRHQIDALQNIWLLFRSDSIARVTEEGAGAELVSRAVTKTAKEWRKECGKYDIYDPASEIAAINIYIAADLRMNEKENILH